MTTHIEALDALAYSRPMLDPANYGDAASYRADQRRNVRDAADYRLLRLYVDPTDAELIEAARGSRIAFGQDGADYCAGQYYPVEYRAACVRLLVRVWWARTAKAEGRTADSLRAYARVLFGRAFARRWFN